MAQDGIADIIKMCGFRIAQKECILVLAGIAENATISTDYVSPYEQPWTQLATSTKVGRSLDDPIGRQPCPFFEVNAAFHD